MDCSSETPLTFKSPGRQLRLKTTAVTPTRRGKGFRTTTPDRFIPSRAVNNFSVSQHLLSRTERIRREKLKLAPSFDQSSCLSPAKRESRSAYQEGLSAVFGDITNRVLTFGVKPLQSADGKGQPLLHAVWFRAYTHARGCSAFISGAPSFADLLFESPSSFASIRKTPQSCRKRKLRSVPMTADRVLDAPDAVDDFCKDRIIGSSMFSVYLISCVARVCRLQYHHNV